MELLPILLSLLVGLVLGGVIGTLSSRARASAAEARVDELREALTTQRERQGADDRVLRELAPVRHDLERLHRTMHELEEERLEQGGRLSEQLRTQAQADAELRAATEHLAAAMRSGTARGNWGEAQLRNLLESAGMLEHVDFATQVELVGDNGKLRPDAVVQLPGEHALIIDAKAPMHRYLEALRLPNPGTADDEKLRKRLLREHAQAVRGHVDTLRNRDYPAALDGSPRLVIAYLPSEAALAAAVSADPALLDDAYARDVALASPTTLWAILRAVAAAWQQERVSDSVAEVLRLSSELYRRLGTASTHLDKLAKQLRGSVAAYDQLIGSLETRVLPTARKLADYDATATPIPPLKPIGTTPRPLSAPELISDAAEEARRVS
ncbi:DNA recombination protein RmuC [Gulosibacter macacae]|uniref:DNA recombination protein RmuC n=1 Tax=Gulosibacter macacae TaxID=2488791 RepID=A0A3P3VUR2_9MICO|nr:DNA recombination protein RmuC [Gulosibacter macacae]RRJ86430.1 DNA recombination protein RmuC [Gulosibacter macacae]